MVQRSKRDHVFSDVGPGSVFELVSRICPHRRIPREPVFGGLDQHWGGGLYQGPYGFRQLWPKLGWFQPSRGKRSAELGLASPHIWAGLGQCHCPKSPMIRGPGKQRCGTAPGSTAQATSCPASPPRGSASSGSSASTTPATRGRTRGPGRAPRGRWCSARCAWPTSTRPAVGCASGGSASSPILPGRDPRPLRETMPRAKLG